MCKFLLSLERNKFARKTTLLFLLIYTGFFFLWLSPASASTPEELIRQHALKTGKAPSVEEFNTIVDGLNESTLDYLALPKAWGALRELQKPSIHIPELIALVVAQRTALASIDCVVELLAEDFGSSGSSRSVSTKFRMAHGDGTYYLRQDTTGNTSGSEPFQLYGYDGQVYRQCFKVTGQKEAVGGVLPLTSRDQFFPVREHPLCMLMLVDSVALLDRPVPAVDFAVMVQQMKDSLIVFETQEILDGVHCTVVASGSVKALIDIENGCVLRRIDTFAFKRLGDTAKKARILKGRRTFERMKDFGNGIVLPQLLRNESYDGHTLKHRTTAKVEWRSINQAIPVSLTRDIIPKGNRVINVSEGLIYREGVPGSVESMLRDSITVGSRKMSWMSIGWIVAINICCLVVFCVASIVAARRKTRGVGK